MTIQLPLNVTLRDDATLANYYPGDNHEIMAHLRDLAAGRGERVVYLWGRHGTGKTHLLQAVCQEAGGRGATAAYVPLIQLHGFPPSVTEGLEQLQVVCVDDVQTVAGLDAWQVALFDLFNRCRDGGARLLVSGSAVPAHVGLSLDDLTSRLGWGLVCHVRALRDEQLTCALQLRARRRGIELPEDVAAYLLRRCRRDTTGLFSLLERLDVASLAEQRRLTIPFVRQWI